MTTDLRDIYVFRGTTTGWQKVRMIEIKTGDLFKMYESDGSQVFHDGRGEWFATRDAFLNESGVATVLVDV
jgi:hypothetical protein